MSTAYCFDLDGTVTKEEILPIISKEVGLVEEISALTDATIQGLIPFRNSFLLRCKLLNDVPISKVQEIISRIQLYNSLTKFIRQNKDKCFIITGNLDIWIEPLKDIIGCQFYTSLAKVDTDRLLGVDHVLQKSQAVKEIRKRFDRVVSVGDGMGDVSMFEASDLGIAFGGTHLPIQSLIQVSNYVVFEEKALCNLLNTLS